jgi:cytochrome c-type biogenesis protein CcmH/NrfF
MTRPAYAAAALLLVGGALAAQGTAPQGKAVTPAPAAAPATGTVPPVPLSPNDSALDALTTIVASELRCPVCQGLSIQASPSELSQQMRALVKEQLASGKSPDEVKGYFVSKYGEWILLSPPAHGFNLTVYALPALLLVAGIAGIGLLVKRWTVPAPSSGAAAPGDVHEPE